MKTPIITSFVWGSFCCAIQALSGGDLATARYEDAQELFAHVGQGGDAFNFVDQSLASGRTDLVRLCWQTSNTSTILVDKLKALPDSKFKSDALVAILRADSYRWDIGTGVLYLSTYYGDLANDIIPMVRRYLPDTPIKYEVIKTREQREKLAANIETAAARERSSNQAEKENIAAPPPIAPQSKPNPPTPTSARVAVPSIAQTGGESNWLVWLTAIVALTVGAIWLLTRSAKP